MPHLRLRKHNPHYIGGPAFARGADHCPVVGDSIPLDRDTVFGRVPEGIRYHFPDACVVCLPSLMVNRTHARILVRDGVCLAEDLNSRNGVLVNGVRITEPTALHQGDAVMMADVTFTFHDEPMRADECHVVRLESPTLTREHS